jgi:hypothetical protein
MDFFAYTPNTVVVGSGQPVDLHPPAHFMSAGMVFAVAPELPRGIVLDKHNGWIHGIAQEATDGPGTYFVTACEPRAVINNVKVSVVNIKVIHVQAPGYTMTSLVQPEPGLTLITLREDASHHGQQQMPANSHPQLASSHRAHDLEVSGIAQQFVANLYAQSTNRTHDQAVLAQLLQAQQIQQQSAAARRNGIIDPTGWAQIGNLSGIFQ